MLSDLGDLFSNVCWIGWIAILQSESILSKIGVLRQRNTASLIQIVDSDETFSGKQKATHALVPYIMINISRAVGNIVHEETPEIIYREMSATSVCKRVPCNKTLLDRTPEILKTAHVNRSGKMKRADSRSNCRFRLAGARGRDTENPADRITDGVP